MFDINTVYDPNDIREKLGWADRLTVNDLAQAIMVLCAAVERLEGRLVALEPKEFLTWRELRDSGDLTGYVQSSGSDIDAEVVAKTTCQQCGGPNEFIAMRIADSYRAFGHCRNPRCDAVFEF